MRQIGTLSNQAEASRFAAYLVVQGIPAQSEQDGAEWAVWVRDEDKLPVARVALAEFRSDPASDKFKGVEQTAEQRRREEAAKREAARQKVVTMGQRWRGASGSGRQRPLTLFVTVVCVAIGIFTNMGLDRNSPILNQLLFRGSDLSDTDSNPELLADKLANVRRGEVWRILTPALVHYGPMHLAFNMVMFYQLASLIEHRRGTARLALLMLAIAVPSNLAQALVPVSWGGAVDFAGLSGVVFGLFGYIWMKSRFDPAAGLYVNRGTVFMCLVFLGLGLVGFFNVGQVRIANWAHLIGFAMGVLIGWFPVVVRAAK